MTCLLNTRFERFPTRTVSDMAVADGNLAVKNDMYIGTVRLPSAIDSILTQMSAVMTVDLI